MRDPYDILGVSKNASAAEIKSAFRRQAKKLHPDANKHDPKAATRFAELNAAYEILGAADKRKAFDRGEIDAEGKPRFQGFEGFGAGRGPGAGQDGHFETFTWGRDGFGRAAGGAGGGFRGFGGFEDILKEAFGGARARAGRPGAGFQFEEQDLAGARGGQDITAALTITLGEAATGTRKRVQLPAGKEVDVKIPAGLNDGQTIRLKGQGEPSPYGGKAGDALVKIRFRRHPRYRVEGRDLHADLPVSLKDAVLGSKVAVETPSGKLALTIPAWSSSDKVLRLKGRGLPVKTGGHADLYVHVQIMLPEGGDEELEALLRKQND